MVANNNNSMQLVDSSPQEHVEYQSERGFKRQILGDGSFSLLTPSVMVRNNDSNIGHQDDHVPSPFVHDAINEKSESTQVQSHEYSPSSVTAAINFMGSPSLLTPSPMVTPPTAQYASVGSSSNGLNATAKDMVVMSSPQYISSSTTTTTSEVSGALPAPVSPIASKQQQSEGSINNNTNTNGGDKCRRQKRLQRNRESARVSRQKRRQYLEELEDKVTLLGIEMDKGRREHVSKSIETIQEKRRQVLLQMSSQDHQGIGRGSNIQLLTRGVLSRSSIDLRIVATFHTQQLQSLVLPPSDKFLLWLTLQNDIYFRSGRSFSERLSAARIGDRMLTSGTNKVAPCHGMWPLVCKEVGLSYEQEEKIRNFQRNLLKKQQDSWVHRHTAVASKLCMDTTHDAIQAAHVNAQNKECTVLDGILKETQKRKFLSWTEKNCNKILTFQSKKMKKFNFEEEEDKENCIGRLGGEVSSSSESYKMSPNHHVAANLYILNNKLQRVFKTLKPVPQVVGDASSRKKLSRRPNFETLGLVMNQQDSSKLEDDGSHPLLRSRRSSFSSSGSLKRTSDEMMSSTDSMDCGEDQNNGASPPPQAIDPKAAQEAAAPIVDKALGFVKEIIPPPKPSPSDSAFTTFAVPVAAEPDHVTSVAMNPAISAAPQPAMLIPDINYQTPHPSQATLPPQQQHHQYYYEQPQPQEQYQQQQQQQHYSHGQPHQQHHQPQYPPEAATTTAEFAAGTTKYSYSCPNLAVVPEERSHPENSVDILFDLTEEDWAIGGGCDLDEIA